MNIEEAVNWVKVKCSLPEVRKRIPARGAAWVLYEKLVEMSNYVQNLEYLLQKAVEKGFNVEETIEEAKKESNNG